MDINTVRHDDIEVRVKRAIETFHRYEFAPIPVEKTAGKAIYTLDGEVIAEVTLFTSSAVKKAPKPEGIFAKILNLFK